jgi:hypothetical protein
LHVPQGSIASAQGTRRGGDRAVNLNGWQAFMFTFTVDWPVSLVVGRPQLLQYQLLFKHLFTLKYWERQLNGVWLQLQQTRRLPRLATLAESVLVQCLHAVASGACRMSSCGLSSSPATRMRCSWACHAVLHDLPAMQDVLHLYCHR